MLIRVRRADLGQRGFTLVEVLVVLALTGMIAVLLLQMMTVLLRGHDQVGRIQSQLLTDTMRFHWFRDSIGHMAASLDEEFGFVGSHSSFSGYTMAPLLAQQGKLTKVSWEIRSMSDGPGLWYQEAGAAPMLIGRWPYADDLSFEYRGQRSAWLSNWPAGDLPAGVLPYRIKLSIRSESETRDVYAAVDVRRVARFDYRDYIN